MPYLVCHALTVLRPKVQGLGYVSNPMVRRVVREADL